MAIYTPNSVPILDLSPESLALIQKRHDKALKAIEDPKVDATEHYLVGEAVWTHCPDHQHEGVLAPGSDWVRHVIGGSTLDEALKDVIGGYDQMHAQGGDHVNPPDWVASTDGELASLLAEHYTRASRNQFGGPHTCVVRDPSEIA